MTVSVGVDRIKQIAGRDELCVAHGTCPGSAQIIGGDVAALEDLQRSDKLRAGALGSLRIRIGKRRKRARHVVQAIGLRENRAII